MNRYFAAFLNYQQNGHPGRPLPKRLAGTTQSSVRVAAGGIFPDAKFNIFWRPHISEGAPFCSLKVLNLIHLPNLLANLAGWVDTGLGSRRCWSGCSGY